MVLVCLNISTPAINERDRALANNGSGAVLTYRRVACGSHRVMAENFSTGQSGSMDITCHRSNMAVYRVFLHFIDRNILFPQSVIAGAMHTRRSRGMRVLKSLLSVSKCCWPTAIANKYGGRRYAGSIGAHLIIAKY